MRIVIILQERKQKLKEGKKCFDLKGNIKTSMRDIAMLSGDTVQPMIHRNKKGV